MSIHDTTAAPTGRKKLAHGKERRAARLGPASQNTSNPEGAKEGGDLPTGWRWVTLRGIAAITGGVTKGQKRKSNEIVRRVPYLRVANVQRGYLDLSEKKEIEATESEIETLRLQPGDILFNEGGDRDKLGRGWIWNNELPECIHQNHVFRARLRDSSNSPRFVSYYGNSAAQKYFYDQGKHTTNLASINLTKLGSLPIPLPPADEQRRIVAEIEKQFTRLEAGVAALRRVQANLKRYRAAVLKAACEGRLVPTEAELARQRAASHPGGVQAISRGLSDSAPPGNASPEFIHPEGVAECPAGSGIPSGCGDLLPDVPGVSSRPALLNPRLMSGSPPGFSDGTDETGAELLARILTERRQNWQGRGKYKEPAAPDTEKLAPLPEGWAWASAEQLTFLVTSGSRGWGEFYSDAGPLFIRAQDIKTDSLKLDGVARVTLPAKAEGMRSSVENRDLLITITGANVTKSAIVRGLSEVAFVSQHVALLKPVCRGAAAFQFVWIISPAHGRKTLEKWAYGAGKPGLSLEQVRSLPIPLPPLAEQARIVAEVERRLSVVEELESVVTANLQRATRLRQSILQRAFTGGLATADASG